MIQWYSIASEWVEWLVPVAEADPKGELGTSGTDGGKSENDAEDGDNGAWGDRCGGRLRSYDRCRSGGRRSFRGLG